MTDHDPANTGGPGEVERELARLRATILLQERTIKRHAAELALLRASAGQPAPVAVAASPAARIADIRPPSNAPAFPLVPGSDYTVVFDGGADPNPGRGYGSFQIVGAGGVVAHRRVELGDRVTNNQAEYRTLVRALETLAALPGLDTARAKIAVRGDSELLIKQITGRYKVNKPELRPLHQQVIALLGRFQGADVKWHGRANSVRVLGH